MKKEKIVVKDVLFTETYSKYNLARIIDEANYHLHPAFYKSVGEINPKATKLHYIPDVSYSIDYETEVSLSQIGFIQQYGTITFKNETALKNFLSVLLCCQSFKECVGGNDVL